LGLGGNTCLRSYEPYVVLGNGGWKVQTDLRTPAISLDATGAALQPCVCLAAGYIRNRIDKPAEASDRSSVGVDVVAGERFQLAR
jgi:hemolysin activation/secretion protein